MNATTEVKAGAALDEGRMAERGGEGLPVDETIARMESLYRAVTGSEAPAGDGYAPIPAEKDPTRHVEEQMDRLLQLLGAPAQGPGVEWSPPMSVLESDKEVLVCLDLPGVAREGLDVHVHGGILTIAGERPFRLNDHRLSTNERPLGRFRRTLMIPVAARTPEIHGALRDGVLEIRIPKQDVQPATSRRVPVS